MKKIILALAIVCIFLASGCIETATDNGTTAPSTDPQERCVEVCKEQLLAGVELNMGPCLSESSGVSWEIEDWACDVAHEPRKDIDENSRYQCQKYRKEEVSHFVEVTPNCEFIRKL